MLNQPKQAINSKSHYLFPLRVLIHLYTTGQLPNIASIDVEPTYGRVGRITYKNGEVRMIAGSGLDINQHDAALIVKDKGYTKYFLQNLGYKTPVGQVFLMPKWVKTISKTLAPYGFEAYTTIAEINTYVKQALGFPCFIKPNEGSKGIGVYKCFNEADIETVIQAYQETDIKTVIVEASVDLPNYRVNTLGNEVICCYLRHNLTVTGDGKSTIKALLLQKQANGGRTIKLDDPRMAHKLQREGFTLKTVLPVDQILTLHDFSNLSAGATAEDCTTIIHPHWQQLCTKMAHDLNLRLTGIDFLCADITDPDADYSVVEINSAPNLENYAALGEKQTDFTYNLYRKIYNQNQLIINN